MENIFSGIIGIWSFLGANLFSLDTPFLTIQIKENLPLQKVIEESQTQEIQFAITNENDKTAASIQKITFQIKTDTQEKLENYQLESLTQKGIDLGLSHFSKTGHTNLYLNHEIKPKEQLQLTLKLHTPSITKRNHLELLITKIEASYTNEKGPTDLNVFHHFQTISSTNTIPIQKIEILEKPKLILSDGASIPSTTLDPSSSDYTLLNLHLKASEHTTIEGLYAKNNAKNVNRIFEEYVLFKLFDHKEKQIAETKMKNGKLFFDTNSHPITLPKGEKVNWTIKAQTPYFINSVYSKIELSIDTKTGNHGLIASHLSGGSIEVKGHANNGVIHMVPLLTEIPQHKYPDLLIKDIEFLKGKTQKDKSQFKITVCNEGIDLQNSQEKPTNIIITLDSEIVSDQSEEWLDTHLQKGSCTNTLFDLPTENKIIPNLYLINANVTKAFKPGAAAILEADESNNKLTKEIFINLSYETAPASEPTQEKEIVAPTETEELETETNTIPEETTTPEVLTETPEIATKATFISTKKTSEPETSPSLLDQMLQLEAPQNNFPAPLKTEHISPKPTLTAPKSIKYFKTKSPHLLDEKRKIAPKKSLLQKAKTLKNNQPKKQKNINDIKNKYFH